MNRNAVFSSRPAYLDKLSLVHINGATDKISGFLPFYLLA